MAFECCRALSRRGPVPAAGGDNVAVDGAVNHGDGDFDVSVDLTVRADDECTARRTDATRQVAVHSHHRFEVGSPPSPFHRRQTTERAFLISRASFALGHRAALGRRRFGGRFCFNTCSLIGGVGFGSGVVRNLRLWLEWSLSSCFGILSILSISYL